MLVFRLAGSTYLYEEAVSGALSRFLSVDKLIVVGLDRFDLRIFCHVDSSGYSDYLLDPDLVGVAKMAARARRSIAKVVAGAQGRNI